MRLRFTRPALADLDAVLDTIATQSPEGAQRVQRRIKAIIERVRANPASAAARMIRRSAAWRRRPIPI